MSLGATRIRLYFTAALFLAGFVQGAWDFRHPDGYGFGAGFEMVATARSLVATGVYGNPFEPHETGPTAANPPLYPILLAGLIKIFGEPGFVRVALLLNIVLNAAIAASLPRLLEIVCADWRPGVAAGGLWILAMRLMPQWDTTSTVAGLIAVFIIGAREVERGKPGLWSGLLAGSVTLLNPSTVLILAPWVAYLLKSRGVTRRQGTRYAAVLLVMVAVCNTPWVARNYRVWGAPVLRTNFGYTLYCSNNDCASPSLFASSESGCYWRTHPSGSAQEIALMQQVGEYAYDRDRNQATRQWIKDHPRRFAELTAARAVEFWFPDPGANPRTNYAIWLITALSIPGLFLLLRSRAPIAPWLIASHVLYPTVFYIVVSCDRYRLPLLWASLIPAGYFVARWLPARTVK